jgi:biopolymer transport protein ExbD
MAIKHGSKVEVAFSAASMTDLMFLLLMFMLIATTLINPNALKLLLPKSANQIREKPYTNVSITSDLRYYVEDQAVQFSSLEGALQAKLEGREEPMVSLRCDRTVPIDEVVKVMNIAKDNDYKLILETTPN